VAKSLLALPSAFALLLFSASLIASSFDNEGGRYRLTALPDAVLEAERSDRMQLCDQQPAGRYVRKNELVTVTVAALPSGHTLDVLVGFQPMWGSDLGQQEEQLDEGTTRFRADQDGPLFFRFLAPAAHSDSQAEVAVGVSGGRPLPLYVDGSSRSKDWAIELAAHAAAPFVQFIGDQALITLPTEVHAQEPIGDPHASFAAINEVLDLQNALSGFDGSSTLNQPTRLRVHYLVDFRASAKDREGFYMYATDQFIGMLDDNTTDLTAPDRLRQEWGIWHETGHTHQQNSWTPEALTEVNVNLYSLYVQEAFGQESALARSQDGEPSYFDKARAYLARGSDDLLVDAADEDEDGLFVRLVMFHQLKAVFGWELYQNLNRHFRAAPLPSDATDQHKADALVLALCALTGEDLRPFFERWGLRVSTAASRRLDVEAYPLPKRNYSAIF